MGQAECRYSISSVAVLALAVSAIGAGQSLTEFPVPTPGSQPYAITTGPDGNLWFTEDVGGRIGRITPEGIITEFGPLNRPHGIVAGPDGALWVAVAGGSIARITITGAITEFAVPAPDSLPENIVAGSDGALWFTESVGDRIGRCTTAGFITEFSVPTPSSFPSAMTVADDGGFWFTEVDGNRIGRISLGGAITEYEVPTPNAQPYGITTGPDGALWFSEFGAKKIGRVTIAGLINEFSIPPGLKDPNGIVTGPDGALWFGTDNPIVRMTTDGTFSQVSLPTADPGAGAFIVGPDGALWFTENTANRIGRLVIAPFPCVSDTTALCLSNGRFRVTADWVAAHGDSGQGQAISLSADSGYFWFFNQSNIELVVKVLDGCSFNQHHWVFAAGLTNVAVTLRVTDTFTGETKTYFNPPGTAFLPIQDTSAFEGCP